MDWLRPHLRWVTVPSWFLSILFHVGLGCLLLVLAQLPSCQRDIAGNEGDSFREVGIHLKPAQPVDSDSDEASEAETHESVVDQQVNPLASPEIAAVPDQPPVSLELPKLEMPAPVIGAGQLPSFTGATPTDLIQPSTVPAPDFGAGGAPPVAGGTSFLGIQDVGKRFVYVIDRSFSMETGRALQAAKMELLASLSRLDETQQFQVIFYNNEFVVLQTRGGRFDLFWGTDAQRLQVSEQLRVIEPRGGTRHLPALLRALEFNPDVIFLLTDGAAESALSRKELEDVRRHNRQGARIHCIEFGRDSTSPTGTAGNFLKQLTKQNGGQYSYRDVRTLN